MDCYLCRNDSWVDAAIVREARLVRSERCHEDDGHPVYPEDRRGLWAGIAALRDDVHFVPSEDADSAEAPSPDSALQRQVNQLRQVFDRISST